MWDGLDYLSLFLDFAGKYNVQSKLRQGKEVGRKVGTPGFLRRGGFTGKGKLLTQLPQTGMWVHVSL